MSYCINCGVGCIEARQATEVALFERNNNNNKQNFNFKSIFVFVFLCVCVFVATSKRSNSGFEQSFCTLVTKNEWLSF